MAGLAVIVFFRVDLTNWRLYNSKLFLRSGDCRCNNSESRLFLFGTPGIPSQTPGSPPPPMGCKLFGNS